MSAQSPGVATAPVWSQLAARWRRTARLPFVLIATAAALLPLWLDFTTEHIVRFDGLLRLWLLLLPSLLICAVLCWQPVRRVGDAFFAVVLASLLVWLLPIQPREQFADDVSRLRVGMSVAEVEAIMQSHVVGATGITDFFDTTLREQPYASKTYYEAQGEHHSFDNFCLVTWEDGRATAIQFSQD